MSYCFLHWAFFVSNGTDDELKQGSELVVNMDDLKKTATSKVSYVCKVV